MSTETLLQLSLIQAELRKLAAGLDEPAAKVLNQSAALLNLLAGVEESRATSNVVDLASWRRP